MLRNLLTRQSEYVHRHAAENRAPSETPCVDCGKTEPAVTLAECSICKAWRCANCYSQHRAPSGFYTSPPRRPWWRWAVRRANS